MVALLTRRQTVRSGTLLGGHPEPYAGTDDYPTDEPPDERVLLRTSAGQTAREPRAKHGANREQSADPFLPVPVPIPSSASVDAGGRSHKKPWRFRWPDSFRDEVLDGRAGVRLALGVERYSRGAGRAARTQYADTCRCYSHWPCGSSQDRLTERKRFAQASGSLPAYVRRRLGLYPPASRDGSAPRTWEQSYSCCRPPRGPRAMLVILCSVSNTRRVPPIS